MQELETAKQQLALMQQRHTKPREKDVQTDSTVVAAVPATNTEILYPVQAEVVTAPPDPMMSQSCQAETQHLLPGQLPGLISQQNDDLQSNLCCFKI